MRSDLKQAQALEKVLGKLSDEQKAKLFAKHIESKPLWVPNPGPQTIAYYSEADELFYGGQAGGGKTDLGIGLALTQHHRSLVLRRTNKEASKLVERFVEIIGDREGFNGQEQVWRIDNRVVDIGGCQHEDDRQKYKGNPHDLIFFDEVSDFTVTQYRFISAWNRSADKEQRCRIVCAGNPPTTPEGLWVLKHWGPWLDPQNPHYPQKPGDLLWFTNVDGEDTVMDGPGPHDINGIMLPARSRTFIPAKLSDNPDLAETAYIANLAALPEELRAAYMEGRWDVGQRDHEFQVIPSAWVMQAQARWKPDDWMGTTMTAVAMDPAGGGAGAEELIYRHGGWISEPITSKGKHTADGSRAAGKIVEIRRNDAPVIVDIGGGYGGAVSLRLKDNGIETYPFNGAHRVSTVTRDGSLAFANKRSEGWWRVREELDPDQEGGSIIALPPGAEVLADLCTPRWKLGPNGIQVEPKDDIRKRLGRSTGKGDVIVMVLAAGQEVVTRQLQKLGRRNRPIRAIRSDPNKRRR